MLIYRGIGGIVIMFFLLLVFLLNFMDFLAYDKETFGKLNWWLPMLLTSAFSILCIRFSNKHRDNPDDSTTVGRMMIDYGTKHHLFFIPLPLCAGIFFLAGVWLAYKRFR